MLTGADLTPLADADTNSAPANIFFENFLSADTILLLGAAAAAASKHACVKGVKLSYSICLSPGVL